MFWLGAIVSLCYVPGITGAYIATQWPVLALLMTFGLLRRGPFTWFHGLGLLFVLYAALGIWTSPAPYSSVFGLWLVAIMGLCLWFGTTLTNVRGLYAGLAFGGAVSSGVAVFQYLGFHSVEQWTVLHPAGLYVNSVQQGAILALLVVALVSERMWLWVLPLLPGLVLCGSRGAWLALAVGLLGCYVRRLWVFGLVGAIGALCFLLPGYMPQPSSDVLRMMIWKAAWDSLTLFGWGPGIFYAILLPYGGTAIYPEYAHNDALQLLWEYGIGAVIPFAIFAFALSRTAAREWPVVFAFVAAGCYSMPLYMPVTSFLAFVAVGRILREHAMVLDFSNYRGRDVLSREPDYAGSRGEAVPVASHYLRKG